VLWVEDTGSGPLVVLIHAGVMDARTWDRQVPALAERYRVLRYDCPGYGRSDPADGPYRETEVLRGLVDEPAVLVGASRGGRIALDFALAHAELTRGLVLACAGVSGYRLGAYSDEQAAREEAALEHEDWEAVADVTLEVWGALGPGDGVRALVVANAAADLRTEHELPAERPAFDRLGELAVPTLVITAEHDNPRMTELGGLLAERIPRAQRLHLEHSDHFPNMREPDRFNGALLAYLAAR
jgi:pimeloyl-ACP methyl ester carboxylesterase